MAALRHDRITSPYVFDGLINGKTFLAYVEQALVPTLSKGDVVCVDNLSSHKVRGVREKIEAVGASLLYLPPYSPDFNPIEQVFAKLKQPLRKVAKRTLDTLWIAIGEALDFFLQMSAFIVCLTQVTLNLIEKRSSYTIATFYRTTKNLYKNHSHRKKFL
ncbi:hypothetical protein CCP3SC1AL1_1730007 [Gammaproteobacteria bacterium]